MTRWARVRLRVCMAGVQRGAGLSAAGARRRQVKSSNRAKVLQGEFKKLGLEIEVLDDSMKIHGTGQLNGGTVRSHNDHRIAMAGAVAAYLTNLGITIEESESVEKSYPEFWLNF